MSLRDNQTTAQRQSKRRRQKKLAKLPDQHEHRFATGRHFTLRLPLPFSIQIVALHEANLRVRYRGYSGRWARIAIDPSSLGSRRFGKARGFYRVWIVPSTVMNDWKSFLASWRFAETHDFCRVDRMINELVARK